MSGTETLLAGPVAFYCFVAAGRASSSLPAGVGRRVGEAMSVDTSRVTTRGDAADGSAHPRLSDRWLAPRPMLLLWTVAAGFVSLPFIAGMSNRWQELVDPCPSACADRPVGVLDEIHLAQLADLGVTARMYASWEVGRELVLALACVVLGTVLIRRVGTFVAFVTAMVMVAFGTVLVPEVPITAERAGALPGWLHQAAWVVAMCTVAVPWFLLPSGRFVPRWGWIPAAATMAAWTWLSFEDVDTGPDPVLMSLALGLLGFGVGAQVYRFRRASTLVERQQLKWLGIGLIGWFATLGLYLIVEEGGLLDPDWPGLGYPLGRVGYGFAATAAAAIFPFAWSMAILKHRLWDADQVLNRGTLAVTLTGGLVLTYLGTVFLAAAVADNAAGPLAAMVLVGVAIVARDPVKRLITRLFYGQRDAPFELLAGLWSMANESPADAETLGALTDHLVESLHFSGGRIEIAGSTGPVYQHSFGSPVGAATDVALRFGEERVGVLTVWPRPGESTVSQRDRRLVSDASAPLAHLAATVRLTGDLRRSQAELVDAREEERRRIHRDLHDDLGPTLAGQALLLDAVTSTIDDDPTRAREFADLAKRRTEEAIDHIRRLSRDLRPAALDHLGLARSLQQAATVADSTHVVVRAEITDLPDLPAATETAAFRIITEGLTNALRHSHATAILIRVGATGDSLVATVKDNGCGGTPPAHSINGNGVGLPSIHDRAQQLGGAVSIHSPPGDGTTLELRLPTTIHG